MRYGALPQSLSCVACRQQFFASSLAIHQKTCFQRHPFVEVKCERCHTLVRSGKYHAHVVSCDGVALDPQEQERQEVEEQEMNPPEVDGRVRCKKCDRAFDHERIAKHQSVCARSRRKVPDLRATKANQLIVYQKPESHKRKILKTRSSPIKTTSFHIQLDIPKETPSTNYGRENNLHRFDPVHRDGGRRMDGKLSIQTSTASSASNPLATSHWMTVSGT